MKQDPYASHEESAAVIVADTRSPEEKLVDQMIADAGAHEQGAEYVPILYRVAVQLAAQCGHFQTMAQDSGSVIIKTACELADVKAQRDELLEALHSAIPALVECERAYRRIGAAVGQGEFERALIKAKATIAKHQPHAAPAAQGEPS